MTRFAATTTLLHLWFRLGTGEQLVMLEVARWLLGRSKVPFMVLKPLFHH